MPVPHHSDSRRRSGTGLQVIVHVQKFELPGQRGLGRSQSTIDAKAARVRVPALPRTDGARITGAIGKFTVAQPRLSAAEVEAGEPVTLTVAVVGEGNLEGVAAPEMDAAGGWQIYKPTSEYQRDPEDHTTAGGAKTFTYTLIADRAGMKATPAMPFSYFDPERRAFVDVTIPPVPISVKPSSASAAVPVDNAKSEPPHAEEPSRVVEPAMTGLAEKLRTVDGLPGPPLREWWLACRRDGAGGVAARLVALASASRIPRRGSANHPPPPRAHRRTPRPRTGTGRCAKRRPRRISPRQCRCIARGRVPLDTARADSLDREDVLRLSWTTTPMPPPSRARCSIPRMRRIFHQRNRRDGTPSAAAGIGTRSPHACTTRMNETDGAVASEHEIQGTGLPTRLRFCCGNGILDGFVRGVCGADHVCRPTRVGLFVFDLPLAVGWLATLLLSLRSRPSSS